MGLLEKCNQYLEQEQTKQKQHAQNAAASTMAAQKFIADPADNYFSALEEVYNPAATLVTPFSVKPQTAPMATAMATKPETKHKVKPMAKTSQPHKLRKFVACVTAGLILSTATPVTRNHDINPAPQTFKEKVVNFFRPKISQPKVTKRANLEIEQLSQEDLDRIYESIHNFSYGLTTSRVSRAERDILTKMVYGEAGRGVDPFEVIHTVLNRVSSPLYPDSVGEVVVAKNQYVGYKAEHPVDPDLRKMVDFVVDDWEAHDCQPIADCHRYYFVTDVSGVCNKFEITPDGRWVAKDQKQYAPRKHYCSVACDQAARFREQQAHNQQSTEKSR